MVDVAESVMVQYMFSWWAKLSSFAQVDTRKLALAWYTRSVLSLAAFSAPVVSDTWSSY